MTLAAALLVWIQPSGDDGFTRRGEVPAGALAVQAMCGEPLRDASDGCLLSEPLTFAYRLRAPVSPTRRLALFGVADDGTVHYYAPTPVDDVLIELAANPRAWTPAEITLALDVHHREGHVRIFGALVHEDAHIDAEVISRWGAALSGMSEDRTRGDDWARALRRDPSPPCPDVEATPDGDAGTCHAIHLDLHLSSSR